MYVNLLSSINPDIESDHPRMPLESVLRGSNINFPIMFQIEANGVAFYKNIDSEQFFCVEFRNTKYCMAGDTLHLDSTAPQMLAARPDRASCAQEFVVSIPMKNIFEEFLEMDHWLTNNLNGKWHLPATSETVADFSFSDLEDAALFRLRF